MIIELVNETIAVDVQAPIQSGWAWTIGIEHTLLPARKASVIAEAHPIKAIMPSLPDGDVISTAFELAALANYREQQSREVAISVLTLLQRIAPGTLPSRYSPMRSSTVTSQSARSAPPRVTSSPSGSAFPDPGDRRHRTCSADNLIVEAGAAGHCPAAAACARSGALDVATRDARFCITTSAA
jgi:hypothetical protein